jgi:hypothetical protein
MATITSAASGDFSDTATWVGGVVPTVGDVAVAATGHVIVIDVDVTVDEVDQAGTGKFTLGNGRTLTANITARAGTFTTGGTVEVVATSGNTATIVGNITGVSTTAASIAGVVVSGDGRLEFTGDITRSAGNASSAANFNAAMYISGAADVEIVGNLLGDIGNHKQAINNTAASTITITGNLTAGASQNTPGLQNETASTITITGNVNSGSRGDSGGGLNNTAASIITITGNVSGANNGVGLQNTGAATITITGNIEGGGTLTAFGLNNTGAATITATGTFIANTSAGINNTSAGAVIRALGECIPSGGANAITSTTGTLLVTGPLRANATGTQALYARNWYWDASAIGSALLMEVYSQDIVTLRNLYSAEALPGVPAEADVKDGVTYGPVGELTGTFEQTKVATLADIVTAVWDTQLSTLSDAATTGGRIRRTATVESTGAQIEALGITP